MTLRRLLFWFHLATGVVVGLVVAFLAITGSLISFQKQLTAFAERGISIAAPATAGCVPPSVLLRNAAAVGAGPLTGLTLFTDPHLPAQISVGNSGAILMGDACTGRILGPGANRVRMFFVSVRDLHRWIALRGVRHESLRALKNAAVLVFTFLILSGLVLWVPRQWTQQHLRPALLFRRRLHGRAREWNLHNIAGVWLSVPLLAIAVTGVIMAYPWANALLFRAAGDTPPPPRKEQPASRSEKDPATAGEGHGHRERGEIGDAFPALDAPLARAMRFSPATASISLRLPQSGKPSPRSLTFQIARRDSGPSVYRDQLTLNTADSSVVKWEPFDTASRGRTWRMRVRYLHTGEIFGAPGQAVALLATLAALLLVWTGYSLSLRRLVAWQRRRAGSRSAAEPLGSEKQEPVKVG